MSDNVYQKEANRAVNAFKNFTDDAAVSFSMKAWAYLAKGAIFALLDIAQAIRESKIEQAIRDHTRTVR